jgi:YD repeat-containing protein
LALETQYEYNYQGELIKTILPNGKWTETYRDGRGLVYSEIVGYGEGTGRTEVAETGFLYDDDKNLIEQIAPDGTRTEYKYDNLDRVVSIRRGLPPQGGSQ